jgi:hypothetical protein
MSNEQERTSDEADDLPKVEQEACDSTEPCQGQLVAQPTEVLPLVPVPLNEPDAMTVAYQVGGSVSVARCTDYTHEWQFRNDAVALFAAIEPRDAIESVLARLMVGLSNGVMDCLARTARSGDWLEARKVNLGIAVKGSLAVTEIVKVLDHHRGQDRQKVTVGQVNVESGGQAIVGNVGPRGRRGQVTQLAPIPVAPPRSDDDQPEDDQEE